MAVELPNAGEGLREKARWVVREARRRGADGVAAEAAAGLGLEVRVRCGELETLEHHRDQELGVTVYVGRRRGGASTSDLSAEALCETVQSALDIARHAGDDPCNGLVEERYLPSSSPELDLHHSWGLRPEQAVAMARAAEAAALNADPRIQNSEGAAVRSSEGFTVYANSHDFSGHWSWSRHGIDCAVVARDGKGMQRDSWYDSRVAPDELAAPEDIGRTAAARALARLGPRSLRTCNVPVLYEAPAAEHLFEMFVRAVSGVNLYRGASFLRGQLGTQVWAEALRIHEQPHLPRAPGSAPFDEDGVATRNRDLVRGGVLEGYLLGVYAARRLGLEPTGNAGGVHNLCVEATAGGLEELLGGMHRGLLVTDLMGSGCNLVTGDYSQGVAGFWVENGKRVHPVEGVTVAGRLQDMFRDLEATGNDLDTRGAIRNGSVLIPNMVVAGN